MSESFKILLFFSLRAIMSVFFGSEILFEETLS